MRYSKTVTLKDGRTCLVRNGTEADAQAVLDIFIATHGQTEFLTTYPEETTFTVEGEAEYLRKKAEAVSLYKSVGFIEYGRNPKAFRTKDGRWQEDILMRLELSE